MLIFLFVDKRKLFAMTLSFEEFNLVFYGISAKQVIWKCIFILMKMKLIITKRLNALSLILKVTVFGTWKLAYWAMSSWWATLWGSRRRTEQSWLSKGVLSELLFTFKTYYNTWQCVITIHKSSAYYYLRQRVITIYHRYYNLRRLLSRFTTGITIHDIITIHDRTACVKCYSGKEYSSGSISTVLNYLHICFGK